MIFLSFVFFVSQDTEYFDGANTKLYNYHTAVPKVLYHEIRMYH
jgi:hypothetical protein